MLLSLFLLALLLLAGLPLSTSVIYGQLMIELVGVQFCRERLALLLLLTLVMVCIMVMMDLVQGLVVVRNVAVRTILDEGEVLGCLDHVRGGDKSLLIQPVGNKISLRPFVGEVGVAETVTDVSSAVHVALVQ